jgi:hypothetical protein
VDFGALANAERPAPSVGKSRKLIQIRRSCPSRIISQAIKNGILMYILELPLVLS